MKISHVARAIAHAKAFRKIVKVGKKIKMPNTYEKQFWKNIRVVLRKKTAWPWKNCKYSRNGKILKIGQLAKAKAHGKAIDFAKMVSLGQKLKMPKTCEKLFYKNVKVVLCKNPLGKRANIRVMANFENRPACKGHGPCKGYRLCKNGQFGSKIKNAKSMRKTILQEN